MRVVIVAIGLFITLVAVREDSTRVRAGSPDDKRPGSSVAKPPLFEGLGKHTRPVTTTNPDAQRYFDQGLNFLFAFNHDEAIRSFAHAAALDPDCAMAHWGVALANGPHINNPTVPAGPGEGGVGGAASRPARRRRPRPPRGPGADRGAGRRGTPTRRRTTASRSTRRTPRR